MSEMHTTNGSRQMYKVLGINDEVTTCECCGKSNLKMTVVLTNGEGEVRFGRLSATAKWSAPM